MFGSLALRHVALATIAIALLLPGSTRAAQRLAGPELDGVEVRIEPRNSPARAPTAPSGSAPVVWAPPGAKPVRYDSLQLKGLSGPAGARIALINNQSLRSNESAQVTVGDKRVLVQCVAIREKSVLVKVGAEAVPRELTLLSQAPIPAFLSEAPGQSGGRPKP